MSIDLEAIRARAEAATPGTWKLLIRGNTVKSYAIEGVCGGMKFIDNSDAEFIAHSREDIPALLAEVERLQGEIQRLTTANRLYLSLRVANKKLAARTEKAEAVLNEIYERTRPGGKKGGYPYGSTTCIGADVYDIVAEWRGTGRSGENG